MTKLEDIEKAVSELARDDLARFRAWFEDFQESQFDAQIERDAADGKLDWLVREGLDELSSGKAKRLPGSQ
jgi:hypothetical protein